MPKEAKLAQNYDAVTAKVRNFNEQIKFIEEQIMLLKKERQSIIEDGRQ